MVKRTLSAAEIDSLRIRTDVPTGHSRDIGKVETDDVPLKHWFAEVSWYALLRAASAVEEECGYSINEHGFIPPGDDDRNPLVQADNEVLVHDPYESVYVEANSFYRLMTRFFATVRDGAIAQKHDVLKQAWWSEFVEISRRLEAKHLGAQQARQAE